MKYSRADLLTIAFDRRDGRVPAIVQDADSASVLMLAWMNAAALAATLERGRVVFYSRSRQRLWEKGESSGHTLDLVDIATDCDCDTLLVTARPRGPACHKGCRSCFGEEFRAGAEPLGFLATLERLIGQRSSEPPAGSYTARLLSAGPARIAQKVGEEGVEVALAAVTQDDDRLIGESADLLFHLTLLLKSRNVSLAEVVGELEKRHAAKP